VSVNRVKLVTIGVAVCALLCGFVLVCCARSPTPGVSATVPRAADSGETAETEESVSAPPANVATEQPETTPPGQETADATAPSIEIDVPEEPKPELPRYLEIIEEIDPAREPSIEATVAPPQKLELNTRNVKLLRLTREGLPLTRNRSIVLQIDGQGIEWTPKYVAVELERSPAGAWTVVRRRPYQP
jgi:cytoskeletal protein RodZ